MSIALARHFLNSTSRYVTNLSKTRLGPQGSSTPYIIRHHTTPLNKKVENNELVSQERRNDVDIWEPVTIQPVEQKLIKRISVEYHGINPGQFNDETIWRPVYRVPYIRPLNYVIRAKVYLTAISVGSSLYYTCQMLMGKWHGDIWHYGVLSIISMAGLAYIGDYFRRLVVQIYASEDLNYVRLCRFSFFGRRKDMVLPVDCVIRLPEINRSLRQPMMDIKFRMPEGNVIDHNYDNYEFYELGFKLPIGLGGVLDRDRFQSVMGHMLSYRVGA